MPRIFLRREIMTKNKFVARKEREEKQARLIRNIAIGIVITVALLLGYGYVYENFLQGREAVATVNDEEISISQFQARVRLERTSLINQYVQYAQMGQQFGMDVAQQIEPIEARLSQPMQIGEGVLDTMINELIYVQEGQKQGITISKEDVEKELEAFLGYFPDGTPTPIPTTEAGVANEYPTLTEEQMELVTLTPTPTEAPTLTPVPTEEEEESDAIPTVPPIPTLTATPYTAEGYANAYDEMLALYTDTGMTEEDFRFLFEAQLYYDALYEMVTADVEAVGEKIWARHILVPDIVTAEVVLERLEAGEDFGELAVEVSIDPSAETNQGSLGWFGLGQMVPEFEETAFALEEVGDISEPTETQFGFHIIQLLGREERPLDPNTLQYEKDILFQEWLTETKEGYNIVIYDEVWQANVPTDPGLQETLAEMFGGAQ